MSSKANAPLISPSSKVIRALTFYTPRAWYTHPTVWPYLIVYAYIATAWFLPAVAFAVPLGLLGLDMEFYEDYEDYFFWGVVISFPLTMFLNVLALLSTAWSISIKCAVQYKRQSNLQGATHVRVTPQPHKGQPQLCELVRDNTAAGLGQLSFKYQGRKYLWESEKKQFKKPEIPTKLSIGEYQKATGYDRDEAELVQQKIIYGPNSFQIPVPTFKELFKEHAVAPFFVFQMFCVMLWCMDEYWYYSMFTGFMLVVFESTVVSQRLRNLKELRGMEVSAIKVNVWRKGRWRVADSTELLPNDVVLLTRSVGGAVAPCDMLLLEGTCVVNEALLTGETTPQIKEDVSLREADEILNIKKDDRQHVVFGGTNVLMCHRDASVLASSRFPRAGHTAENACIGLVLRTGFETAQGKLVRTIVHSAQRVSANSGEALFFILFLLCFAVVAAGYVLRRGLQDPDRSRYKIFLNCTQILTSVVPPELPMELSLAVNASLLALARLGVFCTEPFRIPSAGALTTCCFDKTGTLTADFMVMKGVAVPGGEAGGVLKEAKHMPEHTQHVLAGCHSLVQLDGDLVGDSMEKAALENIEWIVRGSDSCQSKNGRQKMLILHRHAFKSALKRMSAVVVMENNDVRMALVKGAPEIIRTLLSEVPAGYDATFTYHMRQGARVIALAYKVLPKLTPTELRSLRRADVECELTFGGFAVFECPLKHDTKAVLGCLQESSHRCIMITGDNELTAAHVSRELGIIRTEPLFLYVKDKKIHWRNYDEEIIHDPAVWSTADLCVSGDQLAAVLSFDTNFLDKFVDHAAVFARCTPEQKTAITGALKRLGHTVLMCGDGTNDVGALKQAHVGVALLNRDQVKPGATPPPAIAAGAAGPAPAPKPGPKPTMKIGNAYIAPPPENLSFVEKMKYIWTQAQEQQRQALEAKRLGVAATPAPTPAAAAAGGAVAAKPAAPQQPANPFAALNQAMTEGGGDDRSMAPMVKLGDASIASPFTSKASSIICTAHIARLGRCTLVTTLQMYKILALNCLIAAYSMSALASDGVKFGDKQMMLSGMIIAVCFLCISNAKPLDKLSAERPPTRVFSPYMMLSILGQFAIHLYTLITAVDMVLNVNPTAKSDQSKELEADFKPSLLNSVVFLMTTIQEVSTFANNYQGRPWMMGLRENKPLFYGLTALGIATFVFASEMVPDLNDYFQFVRMPTPEFRQSFLLLLFQDAVGTFLVEHTLRWIFKDRPERRQKARQVPLLK